jgi:hypothetical protein
MNNDLTNIIYNILIHHTFDEYNTAYNAAKERLLHISNSYNQNKTSSELVENIISEETVVESQHIDISENKVEESNDDIKNVNVTDKTQSVNKTVILKRVLSKKEQRDKERETKNKNKENKISEKSLLTKDNLKKWYCDEGYSAAYIAREFVGCRQEKVGDLLKEFGIVKIPK